MARRKQRQRIETGAMDRAKTGLERPFPSIPHHPARHVVYAYRTDGSDRMICLTFVATYAAKKFVDALTLGEPVKWLKEVPYSNRQRFLTARDVRVEADTLEQIVEYEYANAEEEAWELPEPMASNARRILSALKVVETETTEDGEVVKVKKEKVEKPKVDKTGLTTVAEIAEQLGITPKEARVALRKSGEQKTVAGWAWPPHDVDRIKSIIKGHHEQAGSKKAKGKGKA